MEFTGSDLSSDLLIFCEYQQVILEDGKDFKMLKLEFLITVFCNDIY